MKIPYIRKRLHELAVELNCPELAELAEGTRRRSRSVKAPKKSKHYTKAMAKQIRAYKKANPDATQQEIAVVFEVNSARVNHALIGPKT